MTLPSIRRTIRDVRETIVRFPWAVFAAVVATVAIMADTEVERDVMVPLLAISYMVAIAIAAELREWRVGLVHLVSLVVALLLVFYYTTLPGYYPEPLFSSEYSQTPHIQQYQVLQYLLLSLAGHLAVAVLPFFGAGSVRAFWRFNMVVLSRFVTSAIFTGILCLGVVLAITAYGELFDLDIDRIVYMDAVALLLVFTSVMMFLSGVPHSIKVLERWRGNPKVILAFAQYVLLPLTIIYGLLVYLYAGNILLKWELPDGMVTMLSTGFAVMGILAYLLLYPLRTDRTKRWIVIYARTLFGATIPVAVLIGLALSERIRQYGYTEQRYLGLAVGAWLLVISIYAILRRGDVIRAIPVSLLVLALALPFGPWSPTAVTVRSQVNQITELLTTNGLLKNGIVPKGASMLSQQKRRFDRLLNELEDRNALDKIVRLFVDSTDDGDTIVLDANALADRVVDSESMVGDDADRRTLIEMSIDNWSITSENQPLDVAGFEQVLMYTPNSNVMPITFNGHALSIGGTYTTIEVIGNGDTIEMNLTEFVRSMYDSMATVLRRRGEAALPYRIVPILEEPQDPSRLWIDRQTSWIHIRLALQEMNIVQNDSIPRVSQFRTWFLFGPPVSRKKHPAALQILPDSARGSE